MFPVNQDCGPGFGEIDHYWLLANVAQTGRQMPLCCENISAPKIRTTTPEEIDSLARRAREFLEIVIRGLLAVLLGGFWLRASRREAADAASATASLDAAFRIVQDAVANENIPGAI